MRIIAGSLGGRQFDAPSGHKTHPMSEKARGGLFNALGDISGLAVLDAFAGSGGLSLEAVSRGASYATAIDIDKSANTSVVKAVEKLDISGQVKAIRANVGTWSDNNTDMMFDIVLCDPPYDDVRPALLEKLANHAKSGGIVVFSLPPSMSISLTSSFQLLTTNSYGDAQLVFYRRAA